MGPQEVYGISRRDVIHATVFKIVLTGKNLKREKNILVKTKSMSTLCSQHLGREGAHFQNLLLGVCLELFWKNNGWPIQPSSKGHFGRRSPGSLMCVCRHIPDSFCFPVELCMVPTRSFLHPNSR